MFSVCRCISSSRRLTSCPPAKGRRPEGAHEFGIGGILLICKRGQVPFFSRRPGNATMREVREHSVGGVVHSLRRALVLQSGCHVIQ